MEADGDGRQSLLVTCDVTMASKASRNLSDVDDEPINPDALALAAVRDTPVARLLADRPAVVLERLARGGSATNWYYLSSDDRLADLAARLRPGSLVSFYFDDRIMEADPATSKDQIVSIARQDINALVAAFDGDLEMRADFPAGRDDLEDFLADLQPGDRFFYGAYPSADNDGTDAVSLVLPDNDGIVRRHPY
jgi:hypothetical protein